MNTVHIKPMLMANVGWNRLVCGQQAQNIEETEDECVLFGNRQRLVSRAAARPYF